jgi:hypothetical protein
MRVLPPPQEKLAAQAARRAERPRAFTEDTARFSAHAKSVAHWLSPQTGPLSLRVRPVVWREVTSFRVPLQGCHRHGFRTQGPGGDGNLHCIAVAAHESYPRFRRRAPARVALPTDTEQQAGTVDQLHTYIASKYPA